MPSRSQPASARRRRVAAMTVGGWTAPAEGRHNYLLDVSGALRVDTGDIDDHREGGGILGDEAVELRAKTAPQPAEPRDLPLVCEQLVDLLSQVSSTRHGCASS